jgi:hypothetical protein
MGRLLRLTVVVSMVVSGGLASSITHAITLTFDDIASDFIGLIPSNYGGLNWVRFGYSDGSAPIRTESGYDNGRVSGDYLAFNVVSANAATISGPVFNFNSAYLAGAWNDNLNVRIRGLRLGSQLYDEIAVVNTTEPIFFTFDFVGIDTLEFTSFGGTPRPGLSGSGLNFAMDNFNFSVPEPTSLALLCLGSHYLLRRR